MTLIGKNIRKIRSVKGLSQAAFAEMFDLTRASVGAYEEGRAEPKLDTIITIANHFGISLDLIVKKELTVNELYRFDIFKTELANLPELQEKDTREKEIAIVRKNQLGDYLKNTDNAAFLETLGAVTLKNALFKVDRIFQLSNSEHVVYSHAFEGIDYVFAQYRSKEDLKEGEKAHYLLATSSKFFFGNGKIGRSKIRLFRSGEDIELDKEEVLEVWKVEKVITTLSDTNMDWMSRLEKLEKRVTQLENLRAE